MDDRTSDLKNSVDLDRFRLRHFIENLQGSDQLDIREDKVDLADMAAIMQGNPKAVWFKKAGPEGVEVVGNVVGGRERVARALGVDKKAIVEELLRRLKLPGQLIPLSREEAPVQQVVLTGDDIDVLKMPVHLQHAFDGAPYISGNCRFLHRSGDRTFQLRPAPADDAGPEGDGRRSQCAQRLARDLYGGTGARREAACSLCAWHASRRSYCRDDETAR